MPKKENFSIYSHYFSVTRENVKKYGEETIVYMQVGSFYELYGCKQNDMMIGSKIEDVANICDLQCKEKKLLFEGDSVYMAGIPLNSLDKYIEKTVQGGYTAVVYIQSDDKDEKERVLDSVYSPGTLISNSGQTSSSNNIMCIWIDYHKTMLRKANAQDSLVVGISVVDIITGMTSFYQYETEYKIVASNFDELQRYVSVYDPTEVIVACCLDENNDVEKIMDYSGIRSSKIHYVDMKSAYAKNVVKQTYQNHIISEVFQSDTFDICLEFREKDTATKSYCYLLDFVKERNPHLVNNLSLPIFDNISTRVTLANHTLMQLNIIDDNTNESKRYGKKSSVMSFLNQCSTIIGKRKFKHLMTNPTTDEEWLNKEYKMIDYLLQEDNYNVVDYLRHSLIKIRDIEKISRQIVIKKLFPVSISHLYNSVFEMTKVTDFIKDNEKLNHYLMESYYDTCPIQTKYDKVIQLLDKYFIISECESISSNSMYSGNIIIQPGLFDEYDEIVNKYRESLNKFNNIHTFLNDITNHKRKDSEGMTEEDRITYVKIHRTEKTGSYLESTLSRSKEVKAALKKYESNPDNQSVEGIQLADIKFVSGTS